MLETMLSAGASQGKRYFPESGPGTKYLATGDENAGYFGKVSSDVIYSIGGFNGEIVTEGTEPALGGGEVFGWYKFVYKGKFLLIASHPVKQSVSWNQLYLRGLIYGTDDTGRYPASTPTNQWITVVRQDPDNNQWFEYAVRTMVGSVAEPVTSTSAVSAPSEFDDLFKLVPSLTTTSTAITNAILQLTHVVQNTMSTNTQMAARSIVASNQTYLTTALTKDAVTNVQYRPVLELRPSENVVFGPRQVTASMDDVVPPYALTLTSVDAAMPPKDVIGTQDAVIPAAAVTYQFT